MGDRKKTSSTPPSTGARTLRWEGVFMGQEKRQASETASGLGLGPGSEREGLGFLPGFLNGTSRRV